LTSYDKLVHKNYFFIIGSVYYLLRSAMDFVAVALVGNSGVDWLLSYPPQIWYNELEVKSRLLLTLKTKLYVIRRTYKIGFVRFKSSFTAFLGGVCDRFIYRTH